MLSKNFLFLYFFQFFAIWLNVKAVTVNTPRGTVIGYHFDQGNDTTQLFYGQADIFLGIPFAVPPVGKLRYQMPRPLVQYPQNPYNATYYRAMCIQPEQNLTQISEDCLYLSIWTPNASSTTKYPVMTIWIHGGGLLVGNSHLNPPVGLVRNLVSRRIVIASIEYRMGWLGFFATLTDDFISNLGMHDQVLALKFINEEISYFSGDPKRITIFGGSAGAHSVSAHTYSPLSLNLFQQAITHSGNILTCYEDSLGPSNRKSSNFALHACNYTQDMWDSKNFTALKDCLMNLNIQDALNALGRDGWSTNQVQGNPQHLYNSRANKPVIYATCKDEYAAWEMGTVKRDTNLTNYTRQQVEQNVRAQFATWFLNQSQADAVLKIWEGLYLPPGATDDDHMAWLQFAVDVGTAALFTWGTLRDVEYYLQTKNPNVYIAQFSWSSVHDNGGNPLPNWHPVVHGCEDPFVMGYGAWNATDQMLANLASKMWANFVYTGKPTNDNTWPAASSMNYTTLEYFDFDQIPTSKIGYRANDEIAFNQEIPKVLGDYPPNLVENYPYCNRGHTSSIKNTTCYETFGSQLTWTDAQNYCVQNSYGTLVTIGSAFENSDVLRYPSQDLNSNCVVLNANDGSWKNQDCNQSVCYICSY